jgi:hypothetical protein
MMQFMIFRSFRFTQHPSDNNMKGAPQPFVGDYSIETTGVEHSQRHVTILYQVHESLQDLDETFKYTVYDGPACSRGANDVTRWYYIRSTLYFKPESSTNTSGIANNTTTLGLAFYWDIDKLEDTPIYHGSDFSTIEICVGMSVLDPAGNQASYVEDFVVTRWNGKEGKIDSVSLLPIVEMPN